MKLHFYTSLTLRILAISALVMASSFLADYLQSVGFFGDKKIIDRDLTPDWEYGWRHYVYNFTGFVLFLVQAIRTANWATKQLNNEA